MGQNMKKQTSPNLLFHSITRSKQWQICFKGVQESVPQTHRQGRVEVDFVRFADEFHGKVAVASFHNDDNAHFSLFSKLVLYYCTSMDTVLWIPVGYSTGAEFWEQFGSATLWFQVTHHKSSENTRRRDVCSYGLSWQTLGEWCGVLIYLIKSWTGCAGIGETDVTLGCCLPGVYS